MVAAIEIYDYNMQPLCRAYIQNVQFSVTQSTVSVSDGAFQPSGDGSGDSVPLTVQASAAASTQERVQPAQPQPPDTTVFPSERGTLEDVKQFSDINATSSCDLEEDDILTDDKDELRRRQEQLQRLLTCPARPFYSRMSLMGEMFVDS